MLFPSNNIPSKKIVTTLGCITFFSISASALNLNASPQHDSKETNNRVIESAGESSELIESPVPLSNRPSAGTLDRTQTPQVVLDDDQREVIAPSFFSQSITSRSKSEFMFKAQYSPLDMLVLSKWGLAAAYQYKNESWIEFEYNKGSWGLPGWLSRLGGLSEERYQFQVRKFLNQSSFNYFLGVSHISAKLAIGSEALSRATANPSYFQNHVLASTWGLHAGIGNQFNFKNGFLMGVDWLSYHQPLFVTKTTMDFERVAGDSKDQSDIRILKNMMLYGPRITLLKIQIGYSF